MVTSLTAIALLGLVITGTYYDPLLSETGGEAIQLENLGNTAISFADATLITKSGAINLPRTTIPPGGAFLITDSGWSDPAGLRDNLSWPGADLETPLSLANTASWIEIRDRASNETTSRLEWNSTVKAREGKLFTPQGETNAVFRNSSSAVTTIPVTIIIANGPPIIVNVTVTDDASSPGIQLMSYARTIHVEATIHEPNGESFSAVARFDGRDTEFVQQSENPLSASTPAVFTADIAVSALAPGDYTLSILASDGAATATSNVHITVLASSSVSVSGPLRFSGVPGTPVGDVVTITNQGNTERTVTVQHVPVGATCTPLSFTLAPGEAQALACSLVIPAGQPGEVRERVTILTQ